MAKWKYIEGKDTIRGQDGSIIWSFNGEEHEFIHLTNIEVDMEINQDEVPRIGTRVVGHKMSTISLTGSATGYYGEPSVRREMTKFAKGGAYPDMQIILTNDDPDTQAGSQVFVGKGVQITNLVLSELDASTSMLEEQFDFTLEGYDIKDEFDDTIGTVNESSGFIS